MVIDLAGFITLIFLVLGTGFAGVVLLVFAYWASCLSNWIKAERSASPPSMEKPSPFDAM